MPYLFIAICLFFGLKFFVNRPHVSTLSKNLPNSNHEPEQLIIPVIKPFVYQSEFEFLIQPIFSYSIEAKVMSTESYRWDWSAKFSPIDLALVWGPPALHPAISKVKISQGGRFYHYDLPFPLDFTFDQSNFARNSANNHIVPENKNISRAVKTISTGDLVKIEGYLINVLDLTGSTVWKTSISRDDIDGGACEIIYVKKIQINNKVFF